MRTINYEQYKLKSLLEMRNLEDLFELASLQIVSLKELS